MCPLFLVTEKFQSPSNIPPPSNGDRNFSITERGRAYAIILQKKKIIPYFPSWAIEKFRSSSDGVGVSNGDQNSLVVIQHTSTI
jgi:hypothetical protein